jgi:hypothetical protein
MSRLIDAAYRADAKIVSDRNIAEAKATEDVK